MSAAENLSGIREKLKGANVTLIAVSKYASLEQMIEVCKQGATVYVAPYLVACCLAFPVHLELDFHQIR